MATLNKQYLKKIIKEEIEKALKEGMYDPDEGKMYDPETGYNYPWCYTTKFEHRPEEAFVGIQDIIGPQKWKDYASKYTDVVQKLGSKEKGFCLRSGHADVYMFLLRGETLENAVEAALYNGRLKRK